MASTATKIPAELKRQVDAAIAQYPPERKRSAALPLLHLWQERFGFISDEGINWIADKLELQPINILELVTFYPMLRQKSAGKTGAFDVVRGLMSSHLILSQRRSDY